LEGYQKDGDEFLNNIVNVADYETWVSFVNVENKAQSTHRGCTWKNLAKRDLPARKLMANIFWDRTVKEC
jgi:hypothetical protein